MNKGLGKDTKIGDCRNNWFIFSGRWTKCIRYIRLSIQVSPVSHQHRPDQVSKMSEQISSGGTGKQRGRSLTGPDWQLFKSSMKEGSNLVPQKHSRLSIFNKYILFLSLTLFHYFRVYCGKIWNESHRPSAIINKATRLFSVTTRVKERMTGICWAWIIIPISIPRYWFNDLSTGCTALFISCHEDNKTGQNSVLTLLGAGGWTSWPPEVSSNLICSINLWTGWGKSNINSKSYEMIQITWIICIIISGGQGSSSG